MPASISVFFAAAVRLEVISAFQRAVTMPIFFSLTFSCRSGMPGTSILRAVATLLELGLFRVYVSLRALDIFVYIHACRRTAVFVFDHLVGIQCASEIAKLFVYKAGFFVVAR